MDKVTAAFRWVELRLDEGQWFRRGYLIAATGLSWLVVRWAMHFAEISKLPGSDIALIISAVAAPVATVQVFAFNNYLGSK